MVKHRVCTSECSDVLVSSDWNRNRIADFSKAFELEAGDRLLNVLDVEIF